jgi:glycosyltransferase involved in cell wall biosynthesis
VPLKILEAAAHGLPVVATDLLAEQLGWSPERDLLSSPVDDAEAFADNCARLAADPELWERLRTGALDRVRAECDPDRAAATLRELLS